MSLQAMVKSIQNIMRKDAGVDGDAQRLSQLVWMLFLKIIDDAEQIQELIDPKYRSPIPEKFRWRNWAQNPEGITGDELLDFVGELFKTLKSLSVDPEQNPRGFMVREVFDGAFNYMKDGTLIRQVINTLNQVDFNNKDDRHHFNEVYEHMLKELQSAGNAGEFYTPRPLTKFVVDMVAPKLGESVLDPACGTGGFLVNALEYVRLHEVKTAAHEKKLQAAVHGAELKSLPYLLATANMILHGVEVPKNIRHGDMLSRPLRDMGPKDRVDVIVANPPFGGAVKDGVEKNFPAEFRTKDTALLFLVLFIHLLKPHGRAGIVLPDGVLFGEGVATAVKKKLLAECNVHTIVRLPQGVFSPYAGVNTNLIFFEKGAPTKEIWYYQLPLPEGLKQYTKNRGITHEEFDAVRKWWPARKSNGRAWKVAIEDIEARNYNLDFKNPNGRAGVIHKSPEELVGEIEEKEREIAAILDDIKLAF
ncbi:MAG: hypothetical protein A3H70_00955 [Candidatus Komeilibacteria bacterium RIFCSPLOWO2_02_FULL_48_11]|uniref:site-specific DNA-methyltransferase (adenine-specific) n=1 Tax=Candidatus Komeilibacteria bacterium RIFCSPLOWO2_02_FULL_48_11 TaxID=1798553 RepID=A0A1G2BSN5_9BACT|nr:MAG: hypothetical protein A3H70_00955 [Candidatus Komeilibacteria bacterium RIFCSPLOWO2_02_FULL_48_11]